MNQIALEIKLAVDNFSEVNQQAPNVLFISVEKFTKFKRSLYGFDLARIVQSNGPNGEQTYQGMVVCLVHESFAPITCALVAGLMP